MKGKSAIILSLMWLILLCAPTALAQEPEPELIPILHCPTGEMDNGCYPECGTGERVKWEFDWDFYWTPIPTPTRTPIISHEILVFYPGAIDSLINTAVGITEYVHNKPHAYILDDFRFGWIWRVRTIYGYLVDEDSTVTAEVDTSDWYSCVFDVEELNTDCQPREPLYSGPVGVIILGITDYPNPLFTSFYIYNNGWEDDLILSYEFDDFGSGDANLFHFQSLPNEIPCRSKVRVDVAYYPGWTDLPGYHSMNFIINTNDPSQPKIVIYVWAESRATPLQISPYSISFADVNIGEQVNRTVAVFNPGVLTRYITNVYTTNSAFTVGSYQSYISQYGSASIDVIFSPSEEINYNGYLRIITDYGGDYFVNLNGTGVSSCEVTGASMSVSPTSVDYPNDPILLESNITGSGNGEIKYRWCWIDPDNSQSCSGESSVQMVGGTTSVALSTNISTGKIGNYTVWLKTTSPDAIESPRVSYEVLDPCAGLLPKLVNVDVFTRPPSPQNIVMAQPFTVQATIENTCSHSSAIVSLRYQDESFLDGFNNIDNTSDPLTIPPSGVETIQIELPAHDWNWLPPWNWGNMVQLLISWVPFTGGPSNLVGVIQTVIALGGNAQNVTSQVNFNVDLIDEDNNQVDGLNGVYDIYASTQKIGWLLSSIGTSATASTLTSIGFAMLATPVAPSAPGFFAAEAALQLTAWGTYVKAYDPDLNYAEIVIPSNPQFPVEFYTGNNILDTVFSCSYQLIAYDEAMTLAYTKYLGAVAEKDYEWQLTHLSSMVQFMELINANYQYIMAYISQFNPDIGYLSSEELQNIVEELSINGLPEIEQAILSDFELTSDEISDITIGLSDGLLGINGPAWFNTNIFSYINQLNYEFKASFLKEYIRIKYDVVGDETTIIDPNQIDTFNQQRTVLLGMLEIEPLNINLIRQLNTLNYDLEILYLETGDSSLSGFIDTISIDNITMIENVFPLNIDVTSESPSWYTSWTLYPSGDLSVIIHSFPEGYTPADIDTSTIRLNGEVPIYGNIQILSEYPNIDGSVAILNFIKHDAIVSFGQNAPLDEHPIIVVFDFADGKTCVAQSSIILKEGPGYASLSGLAVDDSYQGLFGVNVDIYDSTGTLWQPLVTDDSGYYAIDSIPNGVYSVSIMTPLGYQADEETKEIGIYHIPGIIDFYLTQLEVPMTQRGRGYWMHQVNALLRGHGNPQESYEDMCNYMELIRTHFNEHGLNPVNIFEVNLDSDCDERLEALRTTISPKPKSSQNDKAKAHLTALLLNMVSGKISQWQIISEDSAIVSQAITHCNFLIIDPYSDNDETAKDIAEMINNGQLVPSGWIDTNVQDYVYRQLEGTLPEEVTLYQNYPNPLNPTTEIRFSLPHTCEVKLEIYNIMGQHLTTLVDDRLEAGIHTYLWDGSNNATGVYFYRLKAGEYDDTKKMILLK